MGDTEWEWGCRVCGITLSLEYGCEWPEDGPICDGCLYAERDALRAEVERLREACQAGLEMLETLGAEHTVAYERLAAALAQAKPPAPSHDETTKGGRGVSEKVIGFATLNGVLHLFTSADEFRAWMMANQSDWSRAGWVDGAEWHGAQTTPPAPSHDGAGGESERR